MTALLRRLDALFDAEGSIRALCLLRIFVGPIVLLHLAPFLSSMAEGRYYADAFYDPWIDGYPEAPRELYFALLVLCCVAAVLLSIGLWSRPVAALTFALVAYNFFLSETHFRHNRHFLLVFLMGLTLVDAGRVYSVDAWRRRRRGEGTTAQAPLWPLWLLRCLGVAPYLGSGFSKLIDPDWWSGLVTWDRVGRYRHLVEQAGLPPWAIDVVASRDFHLVFGKVAIFTELFFVLALWPRRTRHAAVWVAVCFHVTIEVSARVQSFSWLAMAGLLIWAVPSERDRELVLRIDRRAGRAMRWMVGNLDWLARFDVVEVRGEGPAVLVIDRDGSRIEGARAARFAASRLPLLAWPLLPTLLPGLTRVFDRVGARAFGRGDPVPGTRAASAGSG